MTAASNDTVENYLRSCIARPVQERPALVVEGGGMRGVYSVAAVAELERRGLRDAFSIVVGSSSGALHAAYFLSRQAEEGVGIYIDDLSSRRFIDWRRIRRIVDIDFLVDVAMKQRHPFQLDEMRRAPGTLIVVVTDVATGQARSIEVTTQSLNDVYELLRATAALPGLYGRKILVEGRESIDGGIVSQVPLRQACVAGAREAVVVLTKSCGHRRLDRRPTTALGIRVGMRGLPTALVQRMTAADTEYNTTMDELDSERFDKPRRTWTLRPSDHTRMITLADNDRRRLIRAADLAREDMARLLESHRQLSESLCPS